MILAALCMPLTACDSESADAQPTPSTGATSDGSTSGPAPTIGPDGGTGEEASPGGPETGDASASITWADGTSIDAQRTYVAEWSEFADIGVEVLHELEGSWGDDTQFQILAVNDEGAALVESYSVTAFDASVVDPDVGPDVGDVRPPGRVGVWRDGEVALFEASDHPFPDGSSVVVAGGGIGATHAVWSELRWDDSGSGQWRILGQDLASGGPPQVLADVEPPAPHLTGHMLVVPVIAGDRVWWETFVETAPGAYRTAVVSMPLRAAEPSGGEIRFEGELLAAPVAAGAGVLAMRMADAGYDDGSQNREAILGFTHLADGHATDLVSFASDLEAPWSYQRAVADDDVFAVPAPEGLYVLSVDTQVAHWLRIFVGDGIDPYGLWVCGGRAVWLTWNRGDPSAVFHVFDLATGELGIVEEVPHGRIRCAGEYLAWTEHVIAGTSDGYRLVIARWDD